MPNPPPPPKTTQQLTTPAEDAPRQRLGCLRLAVPGPTGAHSLVGGDIWLEFKPFPHVRVGPVRYAMHQVVSWSFPNDMSRKRP